MSPITTTLLAGLLAITTAACSIDVARNDDGSLQVDSSITEESVNREIAAVFEDRELSEVEVDLVNGHMEVSGFLPHPDGFGGDNVEFVVEVDVVDGRLSVTVTDVTAAGRPISDAVVDRWNSNIADRLERAAERHPNSTLESVEIVADEMTFSWRIETDRSR